MPELKCDHAEVPWVDFVEHFVESIRKMCERSVCDQVAIMRVNNKQDER